jgi:hypothetical protein
MSAAGMAATLLAGGAADYIDLPLRDAVVGVVSLDSIHCTTVMIAKVCISGSFVTNDLAG